MDRIGICLLVFAFKVGPRRFGFHGRQTLDYANPDRKAQAEKIATAVQKARIEIINFYSRWEIEN